MFSFFEEARARKNVWTPIFLTTNLLSKEFSSIYEQGSFFCLKPNKGPRKLKKAEAFSEKKYFIYTSKTSQIALRFWHIK